MSGNTLMYNQLQQHHTPNSVLDVCANIQKLLYIQKRSPVWNSLKGLAAPLLLQSNPPQADNLQDCAQREKIKFTVYGLQFKNTGTENQESASTSRVSYSKAEHRNNSLVFQRLQNKKGVPNGTPFSYRLSAILI